ncbi:uncharacterized protein LOC34618146 [Cyclospora cayetanensis]|uniref:Uncharacterized protein LOC34618146 n=1 Tax=Cyclospora cayetanensis TaxID=88456 RepID=A0A6P6RY86_9EIME|nr:uncharacterized protein LOC34618146 [Cyclospora cayetanensis]
MRPKASQNSGLKGDDGLYEDAEFPGNPPVPSLKPPGSEGEPPGILKGLLWRRPDEIVFSMQHQQAKSHQTSRLQQQQRNSAQEQLFSQPHAERRAILFNSSRPASTVVQGLLPSHAFAAAASGLAISHPLAIREALIHPQHWRARGLFCVAFFRSGEREVVCIDTRLPCRRSQQLKEHNRQSRRSTKGSSSEARKSRSSNGKGTLLRAAPLKECPPNCATSAALQIQEGNSQLCSSKRISSVSPNSENGYRCTLDSTEAQADATDSLIEFAFTHCHAFEEVWLPLLEKAYAKFLGSYEAVAQRAFCTGGCFISSIARGTATEKEILSNRQYTVVDVVRVEELRLVRLHNPWKVPTWRGEFSDYHRSWTQYPDLKERLNYKFGDAPAAFWMKFESFLENFTDILFCYFLPSEKKIPLSQLKELPTSISPAAAAVRIHEGFNSAAVASKQTADSEGNTKLARSTTGDIEVLRNQGLAALYVTVHRATWSGLSLCGLPRDWNRQQAAAGATALQPLALCTLQQGQRLSGRIRESSSTMVNKQHTISTGVLSKGPFPAWRVRYSQPAQTADIAKIRKSHTPLQSSAAKSAAAAAPFCVDAVVNGRLEVSCENFGSGATKPAVVPQCNRTTPACAEYTVVSRPSALVRYEYQAEGFDMAWVNAPMFLVSFPEPSSVTNASHKHQEARINESQQSHPLSQETRPALQEAFLSITQSSALDVAPISMAVFHARECRRIWSFSDAKLVGVSQAVADGERPASQEPWKGGGCCMASCMQGLLIGAPEPRGAWRDSCLRLGFVGEAEGDCVKSTRRLLVVCYQNVPAESSSLRPNDFIFRTFSSCPTLLDSSVGHASTASSRVLADARRAASAPKTLSIIRCMDTGLRRSASNPLIHKNGQQTHNSLFMQTQGGLKRRPAGPVKAGYTTFELNADYVHICNTAGSKNKNRTAPFREAWVSLSKFWEKCKTNWFGAGSEAPQPELNRKLTIEADEWFVEAVGNEQCCIKLTILKGSGPLIVSPCLEVGGATGAFVLNVFSDLPLERLEALDYEHYRTLIGQWELETAGGSHNFPELLATPNGLQNKTGRGVGFRREQLCSGCVPLRKKGKAQPVTCPLPLIGTKRVPRGWVSNPQYLLSVAETVQVGITLARHDDCWGIQKEQDMAGCMMGLYVFRGRNVCMENLVQQTDFVVCCSAVLVLCFGEYSVVDFLSR